MVKSWKIAAVMVVAGMLVLLAFFAAMNSSKWGYQVGDRAVLKVYAVGDSSFENFTVAYSVGEMTLSLVRIDLEAIMENGSTSHTDSEWRDKNAATPFMFEMPLNNKGNGSTEMVSTPMGDLSCVVCVYDDGNVHEETWVHNGLPVKYTFQRLAWEGVLHMDLIEIPAKYL